MAPVAAFRVLGCQARAALINHRADRGRDFGHRVAVELQTNYNHN
jgi:hypothetical protein